MVTGDIEYQAIQAGILPDGHLIDQIRLGDRRRIQHAADKLAAYSQQFLAGEFLLVILRGHSRRPCQQKAQAQKNTKTTKVFMLHILHSIHLTK